MEREIPSEVLAIAETLNLCLPPPPDQRRVIDRRYAVFIAAEPGPHRNLVQRIRLAPSEVEPAVREIRALFRAASRCAVTWEISPSSQPADLEKRLLALGMVPDREPVIAGMVLTDPLPEVGAAAEGLIVREARGFEDFLAVKRIYHRCFDEGPVREEDARADFERRRGREDHLIRYLAYLGGEPVAAADAIVTERALVLTGGATLPEARGKGVYRALIAARWAEAVRRGTPTLVVQAASMSRPILTRLGFRTVAEIRVLLDAFGP